ncbi:unnamed protein product, partial [Onchocerca flexuosa]|uniref:Protein kinase domain-containing protein n=1 Tax=Onchocerca flexuosa TaxID=387005 RepID=A0A183HVT6_9BILA
MLIRLLKVLTVKFITFFPIFIFSLFFQVADFGLSDRIEHSLRSFCGTKCYMAPEQWKSENYGCKVDIWALGALIFTCLCGYQPFSTHHDDRTLKEQILQ